MTKLLQQAIEQVEKLPESEARTPPPARSWIILDQMRDGQLSTTNGSGRGAAPALADRSARPCRSGEARKRHFARPRYMKLVSSTAKALADLEGISSWIAEDSRPMRAG